jgi:hypothetical protein
MVHTLDVPRFEGRVENEQMVDVQGDKIQVISPSSVMTREEALIHAAWIVALADQSEDYTEFRSVLKTVLGTQVREAREA